MSDQRPAASLYTVSDWARRAAGIVAAQASDDWLARLAAPQDLAAVTGLERAGYPGVSESEESFIATANAGVLVVAYVGPVIAGYGLALPTSGALPALGAVAEHFEPVDRPPSTLHVHDVCVDAGFRGRGIASGLMAGFTDLAASLGLRSMSAVAVNGAEALWCSLGWSASGREPPPGYPPEAVALHRQVPPPR
ncbi:MAG: GNAT family N-acetyltransferase [Ilumatobacteraceae bacterium]